MRSIRLLLGVSLGGALLAAALALLWAGSTGGAKAAAACTAPSGSYPTIQAAINDNNCSTVLVATGHHHENLVIDHGLTLRGESKAGSIIDGGGNGPVIRVTGGEPVIENLTLTGGDASNHLGCGGGVSVVGATATVRDNIISDNVASSDADVQGWGGGVCAMTGTATVYIYNNTIQGNTAFSATAAAMTDPGRGGGIGIWRRHSAVVITGNQILNNVAARLPANNAIWAGGGGILSDGDVSTIVEGNTIQGNVANGATGNASGGGVCLHYAAITFNDNYVLDNLGVHTETNTAWGGWAGAGGVGIYGAPTATVRGNWVMTNAVAEFAQSSASQNIWAGGGGISVQDPDGVVNDHVVLEDNHIINNTTVHTVTTSGADSTGHAEGGGLRVQDISTTLILSNEVRGNVVVEYMSLSGDDGDWGGCPAGGGWYLASDDVVTASGNTVVDNVTARRMAVSHVSSNATGGGGAVEGVTQATFEGNEIADNVAAEVMTLAGGDAGAGGAGMMLSDSGATMISNVISGNIGYAGDDMGYSGGLEVIRCQMTMERNLILGNRQTANGEGDAGGVNMDESVVTSTNDILARNYKAFNAHNESRLTVINGTLYNNTNNGEGPGIGVRERSTVVVSNTIVAGHSVGLDLNADDPPVVLVEDYNLLQNTTNYQGAVTTGTHTTLDQDPKFVNAAADDFHLQGGSPAIDEASLAWAPPVDFYGTSRPQGAGPDMGAVERSPGLYLPVVKKGS